MSCLCCLYCGGHHDSDCTAVLVWSPRLKLLYCKYHQFMYTLPNKDFLPSFLPSFSLIINPRRPPGYVGVFCCNLLKDIPVPNFMLNGVPIDKVSNCKYLGHCINDKLIDDDDMARQRKQIYAQGNALVRKFYMCTETVRMSLFKSYCSSLYTSALWCNYRSESLRKLCVAYNNVFSKNYLSA